MEEMGMRWLGELQVKNNVRRKRGAPKKTTQEKLGVKLYLKGAAEYTVVT